MKLRTKGYYEFSEFLLARKSFKSFSAMLNAAMKICNGFKQLHRLGYSYQDLNDGNFFIKPDTGDVLICDNDNVVPQGERSGIMGKARYMAPEVVLGGMPDKYSDRFSLSVILFMLFFANHPLEGAKVAACPCLTEKYEKQFYGSDALFVYDSANKSNRPVLGVHSNIIRRWPLFPQVLKDAFVEEFASETMRNPSKRMLESSWEKLIEQVRGELVICPNCGEETFVLNNGLCINCGEDISPIGKLQVGSRLILLTKRTKVCLGKEETPVIQIVYKSKELWLKNLSDLPWIVETPSGNLKRVDKAEQMPVRVGMKINFGLIGNENLKGEVV